MTKKTISRIFEIEYVCPYDGDEYEGKHWLNKDNLKLSLTNQQFTLNEDVIVNIRDMDEPYTQGFAEGYRVAEREIASGVKGSISVSEIKQKLMDKINKSKNEEPKYNDQKLEDGFQTALDHCLFVINKVFKEI